MRRGPTRYFRLLAQQARISAVSAMQYRFDFLLKGLMTVFWTAITLVPLIAVFEHRPTLAGWTFPEALVVVAWFQVLKAVLEGGVTPSLTAVVEGVRTGAFDFVLLKPADAQFLVSTARFEPWRLFDFVGAGCLFAYAFSRIGRWPRAVDCALAAALLVGAVMLLYAIWILVVSASFWVVRVDNLSFLMGSIFDAARWPITVYPRALQFVFTFVFPLALMTTLPAQALLGRLAGTHAAFALLGGLAFSGLSRLVWTRAIKAYTSASS